MPRREGSAANGPSTGWAVISWLVVSLTSCRERNSRPFWAKNGPPSGRSTDSAMSLRAEIFAASAAAELSASSGVLPSTTTTMRPSPCGKALSTAASRWRHGVLSEISWAVSVVMAKFAAT